jgi:hypothetical protein
MKLRGLILLLPTVLALTSIAVAQSGSNDPVRDANAPRLGDIMTSVQLRHIKLWFAGKFLNWELAAFELRQIKAGLENAAALYPGIPVSNVTTMGAPLESVAAAIAAKDSRRFAKSFGELTAGCNGCHQGIGRGFVSIQLPTTQPFSNQSFAPVKP